MLALLESSFLGVALTAWHPWPGGSACHGTGQRGTATAVAWQGPAARGVARTGAPERSDGAKRGRPRNVFIFG